MKFDFSNLPESESHASVPPGSYTCRVTEVREGFARDGSVRWGFRLEVAQGEHAGRTAAWDAITWSDRGIYRVKRVLAALGFDTHGTVDVQPEDLVGLMVVAALTPLELEDPLTGKRQLRMCVPYAGYAPVGSTGQDAATIAEAEAQNETLRRNPQELS